MKYRVGDKVKIKVLSRYDIDLIKAIRNLPNCVGTIEKAWIGRNGGNDLYNINGLDCNIGNKEISGLVPYSFKEVYGNINDRFDILDL